MGINKIIDVKTIETYFYDVEVKIRELLQENTGKKNFKIENIFTVSMQVRKRTEELFQNSVEEKIKRLCL